jgi:NAD-dependent SIR2 family protein deacetylase
LQSAQELKEAIETADAVIIGAGSGLSTSAGFIYSGERFHTHFADFEAAYHFHDMYSGGFYPFPSPEETWAYWSRYVWLNRYEDAPSTLYSDLLSLVEGKDYFVLTTNVDHCFQKAGFDKHRLFYTQGDYGLFQCAKPCHNATYDNKAQIEAMITQQEGMRVPSVLVPTCPVCGGPMSMNLRADNTFVEDEGWHRAAERYAEFLRRHEGLKVLYLELGVGNNTPAIIKYPFWRMCAANPKATYACVNLGAAWAPREIRHQAITINADIAEVIGLMLE